MTASEAGLNVEGANAVTLVLSAATSFNGWNRSPGKDGKDPHLEATARLEAAGKLSYEELLRRHLADYQEKFSRVKLDLGAATTSELPSDERLIHFAAPNGEKKDDPQLEALLFQYGRYLLLSSSRRGSPPANLQGMWNEEQLRRRGAAIIRRTLTQR